jgi:hypothetical protein
MINAICFNCGSEKSAAIKMCSECRSLPTSEDDRIVSVCLSSDCLKQENLQIARKYMQKKDRLPGFHEKVLNKAEKIVSEMPDEFQISQSFEICDLLEERFVLD